MGGVAHAIAIALEKERRDIGIVGLIDSYLPVSKRHNEPVIKEEMLCPMANSYGLEIDIAVSYSELCNPALKISVEQHVVPPGTPVAWAVRTLNEMITSDQRLTDYLPYKGKFDAV